MPSVHYVFPKRRDPHPQRTHYRAYKAELREDFNNSCGYCGDLDHYCAGARFFHIDHFAPHSKFPELKTIYANLVYSCPFCNMKKSNKWTTKTASPSHDGEAGFIDPSLSEYLEHIERDASGCLKPKSPLGAYMHKSLNLGLRRHKLIWQAHRLHQLKNQLDELMSPTLTEENHAQFEQFRKIVRAHDKLVWKITE